MFCIAIIISSGSAAAGTRKAGGYSWLEGRLVGGCESEELSSFWWLSGGTG